MEPHPLADLIPPMNDEDYAKLRDDIKENGLLEPITLYEGMILDGRHRYQACGELAIDCRTKDYDGSTPARYVVSLNVNRRHLTITQRAIIAVAMLGPYEEEAHTHMGERTDLTLGATAPNVKVESKRALAQSATDAGVSRGTAQRLKRVKEQDPDLYEEVVKGEVSVRAAADTLRKPDGKARRQAITKPYEINSEKARVSAEATKRRLEAVLAALSGHATGLKGFDTPRAMAAATLDELRGWVETLDEAIREFRGLRSTIKEGVSNGIEERSEHRTDTNQPVEHL